MPHIDRLVEEYLDRDALHHLHVVADGVLGGNRLKAAPLPAMMLSTCPLNVRSPAESTVIRTG